jgi:restriction system protein
MAIPDFQSIMLPFLQVLADGEERSMKEMVGLLAKHFSLTESELEEMLPSGQQSLFSNRVAWTKTHLKNAGLVDNPTRGRVKLSSDGTRVLSESPGRIDMKYLRQFDSYRTFTGQGNTSPNQPASTMESVDAEDATPLELFETSYAQMREALADELLSRLLECPPQLFERIVVKLLRAMGYGGQFGEGKVTSYSQDGGIDGVIYEDKLGLDVVCIQAKRWQGNVGRPVIQAFVGSMDMIRAKKGVVITTADYSRDAVDFVDRIEGKRVVLINGKQLCQLMIDHNVGVAEKDTFVLKEISNDFFEEE